MECGLCYCDAGYGQGTGCCECGNELSGPIECGVSFFE